MYGSGGKEFTVKWGAGGKWTMEWEGIVNKLMRSFKTTQSEAMRKYYMKFFSRQALPDLRRRAPEARERAR